MASKGVSLRLRRLVFARDGGVCAACGCDAEKFDRIIEHALWFGDERLPIRGDFDAKLGPTARLLEQLGFNPYYETRWQADHIVPVIEGGQDDVHNLRTLCVPCHKQRTRDWHRQQSEMRRAAYGR